MRWLAVLLLLSGCQRAEDPTFYAGELLQGSPSHGKQLIQYYGCGSCHDIPGVSGAEGVVGPPLRKIALRSYLAGRIPNTADNMITWLKNPQGVDPLTAMPNMSIPDADARDIARYLYTLR